MEQSYQISWYVPNFINICIDSVTNGEFSGRIYHYYAQEPRSFSNILQLLEISDDFFDKLNFPQASTSTRTFISVPTSTSKTPEKILTPEDIIGKRGEKGTFFLNVKFRQNSSWQGVVSWVEGNMTQQFVSVLELLKIFSNSLNLN